MGSDLPRSLESEGEKKRETAFQFCVGKSTPEAHDFNSAVSDLGEGGKKEKRRGGEPHLAGPEQRHPVYY